MGTRFRLVLAALVVWLPGGAVAQEPPGPFRPPVLPAPAPPAPERQKPLPPLFPMPRFERPVVPTPPAPPASPPSATACGMRVVPVDPAIDPKFLKPVPENGPRFSIQTITPPVPCR
jgi:hypothetical protein